MMRGVKIVLVAAALSLAVGSLGAAAQQAKPPEQVISLADVRRQAKACEEYAQALEAATAALRDGTMSAATGEAIRRHKAVVDPICLAQDAPSAGRNLGTIAARTADIRTLLP